MRTWALRVGIAMCVSALMGACTTVPMATPPEISPLSALPIPVSGDPGFVPAPANTADPTETLAPTATDTASPTLSPTPTHTATSTSTPTSSPTQSPTALPTATESPTPTPTHTATATPSPTDVPAPTLTHTPAIAASPTITVAGGTGAPAGDPPEDASAPARSSLFDDYTVVSFYGRAFTPNASMDSTAILGRLGLYDDFDAFHAEATAYAQQVDAHNGEKGVIPAMNIIYELATQSKELGGGTFLLNVDAYLKACEAGSLEEDYIKPAEEKGVFVFLDNQLGLSSVREQTEKMLPFLRYENVHFFFDAEFHVYAEQYASGAVTIPGRPSPGQIDADDINRSLVLVHDYKLEQGITREVIVGLHGFQDVNVQGDLRDMIIRKNDIVVPPGIDVVIDADGFSPYENSQSVKWEKYMGITDSDLYDVFQRGAYPGIKIFPPNPYVSPSMYDYDLLTPAQLMGVDPIRGGKYFTRQPVLIIVN